MLKMELEKVDHLSLSLLGKNVSCHGIIFTFMQGGIRFFNIDLSKI